MNIYLRYVLAGLPAIVTFGGWQLAVWAYEHFGCSGNLKALAPCFAGGVNLLPLLGIGLFWCQLLLWVAVPISLWLMLWVYSRHHVQRRGSPN
ncbi:hypothetical protein LXT12_19520 [Pelomonas sp. P7]|uniref:Uncharacterized protein n=1 Tax=Pelomonas caseinilytica TaxID=2906763 RepID=A0ABS8XLB9_9BURK|nr:hypothetical protein [Pelomonas sp. P7]MCE4539443.1 hypothetical protein [Pelomonas sp. P7]